MTTQLETFFKDQGLRSIGTLSHWGIKGMRWGIRRSDAELARANASSSADAIRARETLNAIKKSGSLSAASDADLNHLLSRINLEKRYSDITTPTKSINVSTNSTSNKSTSIISKGASIISKGHSLTQSLLKGGETMNSAIRFADSPAGRLMAVKFNFDKMTSIADEALNLKPKKEKDD